jgi:hypothetical protein
VIVLFLLIISIGSFVYAKRFQFAAELWHWRHGNKTMIGNYEAPVPTHWLISDLHHELFTLVNTTPTFPKDAKFYMTAVITFLNWRVEARRLDSWLSLERQWLARDHVERVEENTVKFGDESITCIGGREMSAMLGNKPNVPETDIVSLNCMSEHGLNILFLGEPSGVQPFYTFLSQIRRQK